MLTGKIKFRVKKGFFHLNHQLHLYKDKIWLIGDGRSGTTWVSNLINHDQYYRDMFEPFHPEVIERMKFLEPHQYIRADGENAKLYAVSREVFDGKFWHPRVDSANEIGLYKGLLVKDIFANLFAKWVHENFSDIKIILLIRNPFAVSLSKYKKRSWKWLTDPRLLLNQSELYRDYLQDFKDLIEFYAKHDDFITNQIVIWSILHYVPFKQFEQNQVLLSFYENIYSNPQMETDRIYDFLGKPRKFLPDNIIHKPSIVSGKDSSIVKGFSPINSWSNEIPKNTIQEGQEILKAFNLHQLYDENEVPFELNLNEFN